ncbi:MAG: carbonic anhydrase [Acidimicrobiales bacterium]|nr:carbonic anhydrase [Acidimicrobiales bacterium]
MSTTAPQPPTDATDAARTALAALLAGNGRFVAGSPPAGVSDQDRAALVDGQSPTAVLVGCVDSRVPPELVLDAVPGQLLTIRTAGQALTGATFGSIEFGVRALGLSLVVVLGHTGCGAVAAALAESIPDGELGQLVHEVAARLVDDPDPAHAVVVNVDATVAQLRQHRDLVTPDGFAPFVVGLVYDLATGRVSITDDAGLGSA